MPELPEVEVFRRFVDKYAVGKTIDAVEVFQPKILQGLSPKALRKACDGGKIKETSRRGKQLFVEVQQGKKTHWLLFHFGMTGYFSWFNDKETVINAYGDPKRPKNHIRTQFDLNDNSHWAFHEQRMFGKLALIDNLNEYLEAQDLGPDAIDPKFTEKDFLQQLSRCKGQIKPVLLNQAIIAGIGNIYADEILYQCGINPERRMADLDKQDLHCLYQQMKAVLQNAVDVGADHTLLPQNYLIHFRKAKGICPKDKTPVSVKTVGGRTTYFCPKCQK